MNLPYAYKVLAAADSTDHLELEGFEAESEVRQLAEASLVEATFEDDREGLRVAINRVTEKGKAFLRVFRNHPIGWMGYQSLS
jgi:hypothetical protein